MCRPTDLSVWQVKMYVPSGGVSSLFAAFEEAARTTGLGCLITHSMFFCRCLVDRMEKHLSRRKRFIKAGLTSSHVLLFLFRS